MSNFRYMLRYTLPPDENVAERLPMLADFCQRAHIDEVMFFIEPLNLNHGTWESTQPWLDAIQQAKLAMDRIGVITSINPLNSLLHTDLGPALHPEHQYFQTMTDIAGNNAAVVACPLCPAWRSYIAEMYARYAALTPDCLWVEDDFRLHNHSPLLWGGCFCPIHMQEYARHAGEEQLTREHFLAGILAPGEPHPYRKVWLDTNKQTFIGTAEIIRKAVQQVSPNTRIGLMTSHPMVHAAEARDWHGLFSAFDSTRPAVIRPHLPAYSETSGSVYAWQFNAASRLTAAFTPEQTELYPELENVPYTLYSKSVAFQQYQLETAMLLGSQGITLNIIDMVGNTGYPIESHEQWLHTEKPFLQTIANQQLRQSRQTGVHVIVNEMSSYNIHLDEDSDSSRTIEHLYPQETFWASLLSSFGISNRLSTAWPDEEEPSIIALSGQVLRNLEQSKIRSLFTKHCILLDGDAAYCLVQMGLGDLCNIQHATWRHAQTYEKVTDCQRYHGMADARMRPYLEKGSYLDMIYHSGKFRSISHLFNTQNKILCTGMTIVNDRIFILPYSGSEAMMNPIRRDVIQQYLRQLPHLEQVGDFIPLMITSYSPHVSVHEYYRDGQRIIAITNHSLDSANDVTLQGRNLGGNWLAYSRQFPHGSASVINNSDDHFIHLNQAISPLSVQMLVKQSFQ